MIVMQEVTKYILDNQCLNSITKHLKNLKNREDYIHDKYGNG